MFKKWRIDTEEVLNESFQKDLDYSKIHRVVRDQIEFEEVEKEISKKIGELFLVKSKINLHYDLLDTPEFFWEYPEYENQYEKMVKYLDIKPRVEVLNKKVEVIQELLHVLGDEQKHRYSSFLEWIIIILIAFEIVINLKDHL